MRQLRRHVRHRRAGVGGARGEGLSAGQRNETLNVGRVAAVAPAIAELAPLGRSVKCEVLSGRLDGESVVAKVLVRDDAVWRWYFEREAEILARLPADLAAPRLIAADVAAGVMILSRVSGAPLARRRRAPDAVGVEILDAALAIAGAVASLDPPGLDIDHPASPALARRLRDRLLEDPSAPRAWFVDGVERCRRLGIVSGGDASALRERLEVAPIAVGHGDLLPRNIIVAKAAAGGDGSVSVIDWECAGPHLAGWDRALLWANVGPALREHLAAAAGEGDAGAAFRALCAFALAREVKFARAGSPVRSRLEADLGAALAICRR